jgi:hypothetical protein
MQSSRVFENTCDDIHRPLRERRGGAPVSRRDSCRARARQALLLVLLIVTALGCAAVRGRRGAPEHAGFLGDYSGLAPREGYEGQEVYINPRAEWANYDAIYLDTVTLWASERTAKLGEEERQMLTDLVYASLASELGARFRLATRPGPDVLRMRAALTQVKGANVPLRTLSTIVPQMYLISAAVGLTTDAARTVGTATIEVEIVDSITGERLAAAVDQRAGNKSILIGSRTFATWGDVESACEFWAERMAAALERLGVQKKS